MLTKTFSVSTIRGEHDGRTAVDLNNAVDGLPRVSTITLSGLTAAEAAEFKVHQKVTLQVTVTQQPPTVIDEE